MIKLIQGIYQMRKKDDGYIIKLIQGWVIKKGSFESIQHLDLSP